MGWRSASARGAPVHCCSALRASAMCVALARLTGAEGVDARARVMAPAAALSKAGLCVRWKKRAHQQGRCSLGSLSHERTGRSLDKTVFGTVCANVQLRSWTCPLAAVPADAVLRAPSARAAS